MSEAKRTPMTTPTYGGHSLEVAQRIVDADDSPSGAYDMTENLSTFEIVTVARALLSAAEEGERLREALGSQAAADVLAERRRHVEGEGWTLSHDDEHADGELARAAAAYSLAGGMTDWKRQKFMDEWYAGRHTHIRAIWPWDWKWWKPKDRRQDLVRAGALILAEIERLDRAALSPEGKG